MQTPGAQSQPFSGRSWTEGAKGKPRGRPQGRPAKPSGRRGRLTRGDLAPGDPEQGPLSHPSQCALLSAEETIYPFLPLVQTELVKPSDILGACPSFSRGESRAEAAREAAGQAWAPPCPQSPPPLCWGSAAQPQAGTMGQEGGGTGTHQDRVGAGQRAPRSGSLPQEVPPV